MVNKPLNQVLLDEPFRFDFFQAVRLLEKVYPDRKPIGGEALPAQEIVRFRSRISLDFPASEIDSIRESNGDGSDEQKIEMFVNFMGMIGANGVLPMHYTELVLDRIRYRDTAMWAFMDMFAHRAISMFYRAWAKYRFPIGYERGQDEFTSYLFDFAGLGTHGLRGRTSVEDETLLPYTGLISQKPHSTNAVENILSDYFGVPAKVKQFFGQWLTLGKDDLTRLGEKNSVLGRSAIAGNQVWDQQSKFRVCLGPMPLKQFQAFLPNGTAHKIFKSIVTFLVGLEFDFDMQLLLKNTQVPGAVLTTRAVRRPMLGWTSWLKTLPMTTNDDQVILA
jgi:type VI secretion protein, VC_A0111 family